MAEKAIRKLQLFRNSELLVGSAYEVRDRVDLAYSQGQLELHDGEPISVRYRETQDGEPKGLFGVAYDKDNVKFIIWGGNGDSVSIVTHPTSDEYVTLNYTFNQNTNEYDLVVDANVVMLNDACGCALEVLTVSKDIEQLYWRSGEDEYNPVGVGDIVHCRLYESEGFYYRQEKEGEYMPAEQGSHYTAEETTWTGLADACDVKNHIKYYDVVPGDNIVTISSNTTQVNGFDKTTFTVSISTENLPEAPEYTIGTVSAIGTSLKSYALFKDGVQVGETIDIPKDFLVKSGDIIEIVEDNGQFYDETNDPQHTMPLTGVSAAGLYLDFVVNVKIGTAEPDEHIYIPVDSLVDAYTAGDGIAISTVNEISARISADNGNQISISQNDGGLFVPAGETIDDVTNIDSVCQPGQSDVTYGYLPLVGYVEVVSDGQGGWTYNGQTYTGSVSQTVPCGHRYLIVRTSGGSMYITNNDTSSDVHVSNFAIATNNNDEDVLRITMNDNTVYDVLVSDINPVIPEATVNWNIGSDTMSIGTEGVFTQLALGTIEKYIDNFDCGTFAIGSAQQI